MSIESKEVEDAKEFGEASHYQTDTFMERGRELQSPIAFEHYIKELYEQQPTDGEVQFAVCLTENDKCIGMIGLEEDWRAAREDWREEQIRRKQKQHV
jgi:RimJ/RimL family protein N-acetyltransferase